MAKRKRQGEGADENRAGTEPGAGSYGRRLVTLPEASSICRASRSSLRRWIDNPESGFPQPLRYPGQHGFLWWEDEIIAWLEARPRHKPRGSGK